MMKSFTCILVLTAISTFLSPLKVNACPQRSVYQHEYGTSSLPSSHQDSEDYVLLRFALTTKNKAPGVPNLLSRRSVQFLVNEHCMSDDQISEARRAFELRRTSPSLLADTTEDGKRMATLQMNGQKALKFGMETEYEWYTSVLASQAQDFIRSAYDGLRMISQQKDVLDALSAHGAQDLIHYNDVSIEIFPIGQRRKPAAFDVKVTLGQKDFYLNDVPVFDLVDPTDRNRPEKLQPMFVCGSKYFLERLLESRACSLSEKDCDWIEAALRDRDRESEEGFSIAVRVPGVDVPKALADPNLQIYKNIEIDFAVNNDGEYLLNENGERIIEDVRLSDTVGDTFTKGYRFIEITHEQNDCPAHIREPR